MIIKRFDVVLLVVLATARVRIDTLADLAAPRPVETIQKVEWLRGLLSDPAWKLLADWLTDPLSLLIISLTFGLVLAYVVVDLLATPSRSKDASQGSEPQPPVIPAFRAKLLLVFAIVATTVIAQSLYLVALRHVAGPASYTHDGGVIQTEEAVKFILQGKNPYFEDYTKTPMAQWGLDYQTALYHFPYLPWTFIFSLPVFVVSNALIGWFDERFIYLVLFVGTLLLATRLSRNPLTQLVLVMTIGLNPIMGSDVIFGQNDSFVLFWLVAALVAAGRREGWARPVSLVLFALACASKPTAWFLAPFFLLYVLARQPGASKDRSTSRGRLTARSQLTAYARDLVPFAVTLLVIVLPFIIWDPFKFYDDVWAWSAGTSATAYQIRGWGLSNYVLALNWVPSRLAYFPFWIPEIIVGVPLFIITLLRQWRENTLPNVAWHGALLFFAYAYVSRFLNENYLGFIVALLVLSIASDPQPTGDPVTA